MLNTTFDKLTGVISAIRSLAKHLSYPSTYQFIKNQSPIYAINVASLSRKNLNSAFMKRDTLESKVTSVSFVTRPLQQKVINEYDLVVAYGNITFVI
jgi:hypothetical protein